MTETCPSCNVALLPEIWHETKPKTHTVRGPWTALYELWTGRCQNWRRERRWYQTPTTQCSTHGVGHQTNVP
jgi:hypothetical protein